MPEGRVPAMLLAQQINDFLIPAGSSRTVKKNLASLADAAKHQAQRRQNRETRAIMTALDPACPENAAEAPSPKWTSERVAFITEQYLIYRKSGGEIARMLGPAFTRNSVTGKLFRTGALKARSGMGLRSDHGLPRGVNFGNPRSGSRKTREEAKPPAPRNSPWKSVLKLSPEVRISSKRPKLSSRSTASRSSAPRKASAVGRQGPLMVRRMSAARL
jgi:hypothetical protein